MLIDLHTHTFPSSDDSFMSPDDLIEAAKEAGLDGVCLTEHDRFWDSGEVKSLSDKHSFLVIPGCEVNTDAGHVLVFGLDSYLFGMHKPDFLRRQVDEAGGIMIAAHPYRRRYRRERAHLETEYASMVEQACADPIFGLCDAVEGLNGRATEGEAAFVEDLAGRLNMGMTGSSDSHRTKHIGTAATRFDIRVGGVEDLIRGIRGGLYQAVSLRDTPTIAHVVGG